MTRNGKDFHAYVNKQQTVPDRVHALKDTDGELQTSGEQICRILNNCFHAVFTIEPPDEMPSFGNITTKQLYPNVDDLYDRHVVWARLESLDVNKAR